MKFISILGLIAGIIGVFAFIKQPEFETLLCLVIGFGLFFGWQLRNRLLHGKF